MSVTADVLGEEVVVVDVAAAGESGVFCGGGCCWGVGGCWVSPSARISRWCSSSASCAAGVLGMSVVASTDRGLWGLRLWDLVDLVVVRCPPVVLNRGQSGVA